jgi:hypothetical protein
MEKEWLMAQQSRLTPPLVVASQLHSKTKPIKDPSDHLLVIEEVDSDKLDDPSSLSQSSEDENGFDPLEQESDQDLNETNFNLIKNSAVFGN